MNQYIPYGRQHIDQQDIDEVVDTLTSDFLTQGPKGPLFERKIADICQAKYACAFSSATGALHIACLALELGPDDILWTSPITFVASANSGIYCGADVDFVDVDPNSGLICPQALALKLEIADASEKLPKVLTVVHLGGQSCDMAAIAPLCQKYDIKIIEDASHAIGARYMDEPVGNCRYCDIAVFSFHPVKIITTAEGGIATTQQQHLADKMALLRSHGITRDTELYQYENQGPWYYEQLDLGFNYRMTELQAALGLSQCDKLDDFIITRNQKAQQYDDLLSQLPVTHLTQLPQNYSAYHLYVILVDEEQLDRAQLFAFLRERQIGVNVHYIPVHTQPYYRRLGFAPEDFPGAMTYYKRAISLPLFADLTDEQQNYVVSCIKELANKHSSPLRGLAI